MHKSVSATRIITSNSGGKIFSNKIEAEKEAYYIRDNYPEPCIVEIEKYEI